MFGYVRPSHDRMTEGDRARFQALYCGLCRALGERYGAAARFILNYDFTFLAALVSEAAAGETVHRTCMAHPIKGRDYFPGNEALALAADCSVILAWWQLQDAIEDHGSLKAVKYRAAAAPLKKAYEKARTLRPAFDKSTREQLDELGRLEEERCPSLDRPADTFARLLAGIAAEVDEPVKARVLEQLFYHLGRWIYLIDAADDLERDFSDGSYNPLIYRFALTEGKLTGEDRESLVLTLDHSIRLMAAACELWDFGVWSDIIRSTVYEGLFRVGKAVLEGTFHTGVGPLARPGRDKEQL